METNLPLKIMAQGLERREHKATDGTGLEDKEGLGAMASCALPRTFPHGKRTMPPE